jgi:hypothetical protein
LEVIFVVYVQGFQMNAKRIEEKKLVEAWKTMSRKPMPKVKALKLSDKDFNQIIKNRHCIEDDFREIEEWGRILSTKGTDACVFNADEADDAEYVILVRENPHHRLDKIIIHELSHIARGDL